MSAPRPSQDDTLVERQELHHLNKQLVVQREWAASGSSPYTDEGNAIFARSLVGRIEYVLAALAASNKELDIVVSLVAGDKGETPSEKVATALDRLYAQFEAADNALAASNKREAELREERDDALAELEDVKQNLGTVADAYNNYVREHRAAALTQDNPPSPKEGS